MSADVAPGADATATLIPAAKRYATAAADAGVGCAGPERLRATAARLQAGLAGRHLAAAAEAVERGLS